MFRIICILKSNQSYKRIVSQFDNPAIIWEENIPSLSLLQEKAVYTTYRLAIVDEKLPWCKEAIEFLDKMRIPYLYFMGDFEEVERGIKDIASCDIESEEVLKISTEEIKEEEPPTVVEGIKIVKDIEYVPKEVPVTIYRSMYGGIDQQVVIIANLSRRAGSSFITMNFARMLAKMNVYTSIVEPPFGYPYMFNAIGIDKKIDAFKKASKKNANAPDFYSYPHAISNNEYVAKNRESIIEDIIWVVPDPRLPLINVGNKNTSAINWDLISMVKLVYSTKKAPIKLVDVGDYLNTECVTQFLPEADLILIVIDPMPPDCMENMDKLNYIKELKEKGLNIKFVANKWSLGIDGESFSEFLKEDLLMKVPYVSPYYIYQAMFEYKIPYDVPEVEDILAKPFTDLAKLLVPKEIIIQYSKDTEEDKIDTVYNKLTNLLRRKKKDDSIQD